MTKTEAQTLRNGDLLTATRSGKTYHVNHYDDARGTISARQLRNGEFYGAIRQLLPSSVERLSPADDRHPASQALTAILQPTTIRTTAAKLTAALTPQPCTQAELDAMPAPAPDLPPAKPARPSAEELSRISLGDRVPAQFEAPQTDASKERILVRRVVRMAERWHRKFPCPEAASDPELAAVWRAVEQLLAHDSDAAPAHPMAGTRCGELTADRDGIWRR